jgi:hypothetical protein
MYLELDLEGHGVGELFAIPARRQAAKQMPVDLEKFNELLASGVAPAASNGERLPARSRSPRIGG